MMKKTNYLIMASVVFLTACQQQPKSEPLPNNPQATASTATPASAVATQQKSTNKTIDWALIDSGEKAIPTEQFNYPFKLDSEPVKAYAKMYNMDATTARHNLTIGMAVNEVLSKLLDQVGTAYVSHELTTDKPSKFIVHTTKTFNSSKHNYVFAEPYAKGLTIDVEIINDGNKDDIKIDNPHASSPQN